VITALDRMVSCTLQTVTSVADQAMAEDDQSAQDNELPSVMTCANYIKLPQYSSKEVCLRQMRFAFTEGQGSFDLS
jgi:E3 ubiquitin-protein ligase TRIP12